MLAFISSQGVLLVIIFAMEVTNMEVKTTIKNENKNGDDMKLKLTIGDKLELGIEKKKL